VEAILEVLGSLAARPVPEEELLRVQRRHRMTLAFSLDSAAELAGWYGSGEVLSSPEGFEERCRRVERVTSADVLRVARATFRRRNAVLVVVGPSRRRERSAIEKLLARTTAVPE
jgi:predicted Zn-dependent peptidase